MNTKLTFFWTHTLNQSFSKTVFQVVTEDKIEDKIDAQNWIDENTDTIFNDFGFEIVFDHVVMNFTETPESISDVKILETFKGELVFSDHKNTEIEELKEKIKILEMDLEIEILKRETNGIKLETEKLKKELKKDKDYKSVWIEPDGSTHEVGMACHDEFAGEWLQDNLSDEEYDNLLDNSQYSYENLQDRGWCRILGWTNPPTFVIPKTLTPRLKKSIKTYCQNNGVMYPERIKD